MLLCYVDESGDPGYKGSPTQAFVLACVVVPDEHWLPTLDMLVRMRRYLHTNFGLSIRAEIKASELVKGKGPWAECGPQRQGLSPEARLRIYRLCLRALTRLPWLRVFAVVIDKYEIVKQSTTDPRDRAWTFLIQRLERRKTNVMLLPDDGHNAFIDEKVRQMRRFNRVPAGGSSEAVLSRPALNVVEDPAHRSSRRSYFVQMADLCAYAAHRFVVSKKPFPQDMWLTLTASFENEVNSVRGGPPGIVKWP